MALVQVNVDGGFLGFFVWLLFGSGDFDGFSWTDGFADFAANAQIFIDNERVAFGMVDSF
jgi:hypothetical protein